MEDRERALRLRYARGLEKWSEHTKKLPKLCIGDIVLIQNQHGTPKSAKRWDKSGEVIEVLDFDKYLIKVDGTGRVTTRNRRFLRKAQPYQPRQPVGRSTPILGLVPEQPVVEQPPIMQPVADKLRDLGHVPDQEPHVANDSLPLVHDHDMVECQGEEVQGTCLDQEDQPAVQEDRQSPLPRRSGRVRRTNILYNDNTWDLDRDG